MNIFFYRHKKKPPAAPQVSCASTENRQFQRLPCQLEVNVIESSTRQEVRAQCLNISRAGMRINIGKVMHVGEKLELWVHLNDGLAPIHRFAQVVWLQQLAPFIYSCGLKFEPLLQARARLNN